MSLLEIKNLTVGYDTATVLDDINLEVKQGELVGIIGPNGAGKTTLLRAISGLVQWQKDTLRGTSFYNVIFEGDITFKDENIKGLAAHRIAARHLVLCPERARPFRELTVAENLRVGAFLVKDGRSLKNNLDRVYKLFPRLLERAGQISGTLSGGERQMLAIGRALMAEPELLLIDEPTTGLAPIIKQDLFQRIKEIRDAGITVVLVEQDVNFALDLATCGYILSNGRVVASGTGQELLANKAIRSTYIGL